MLACRYQLTVGALAAMRGHLSDCSMYTRRAVELCGFAALVMREPARTAIWFRADESEEIYNEYRKQFRNEDILPRGHALLGPLYKRYDQASKQMHASVKSFANTIEPRQASGGIVLRYHFFQVHGNEVSESVKTFFWLLDTHFEVLGVLEDALGALLASDRAAWDVRRTSVGEKLRAHKARWP